MVRSSLTPADEAERLRATADALLHSVMLLSQISDKLFRIKRTDTATLHITSAINSLETEIGRLLVEEAKCMRQS